MKRFALALLVSLAGCFQFEEGATLMPDGSGKLTVKFAIKQSSIKMLEELSKNFGGEVTDPFADYVDAGKLKENSEGFAAWSEGKKETDGEWVRVTLVGYFEDINKARFYTSQQQQPGGEKKKTLSFAAKYEKAGAGGKLSPVNEFAENAKAPGAPGGDPNDELGKAMIEAMKPMLEGMKVSVSVTVPGPIDDAGLFPEKKDRTARFTMDSKMFFDTMKDPNGETAKKLKAMGDKADKGAPVTWSKTTVTDDEVAAFKRELAAAKESWAKRLEASKKKAAPEKDK